MPFQYIRYLPIIILLIAFDATGICIVQDFVDIPLKYAKTLEIKKNSENIYLIIIKKPWINSKEDYSLYLLPASKKTDPKCPSNSVITPLQSIAAISTSHVAFLEVLGLLDKLKAFSNLNYVNSQKFKTLVHNSKIIELGYPINRELLLKTSPDVLFAYSALGPKVEGLSAIEKMGVPIIYMGEYRETTPLARLEWIKLYGLLFDRFSSASLYFSKVEKRYLHYKKLAESVVRKKKVIVGFKAGAFWVAPGDKSDLVSMINDAGGEYVFQNYNKQEMLQLHFEVAIDKSVSADVWLPNNLWQKKDDIMNSDNRYKILGFLNKKIFNNNKQYFTNGGNDFWESAMVKPDLLLMDLIWILNPRLLSDHKLYWYQEL